MTDTTTTTAMKSYIKEFTLHLGVATTTGRLVALRLPTPSAGKFKYVSPTGEPVKQKYVDPAGHTYDVKDLAKGVEDENGKIHVVDADTLAATKASTLPKDVMNITVHPVTEVEDQVFPSDNNAYVFYPNEDDPANKGYADFILTAVENSRTLAFMGTVNLRNSEGLYRLTVWRGHLVIQRMLYPEQLQNHRPQQVKLPASTKKLALTVVEELSTPFHVETYRDEVNDRLVRLVEAVEAGQVPSAPAPAASVAAPVFDLEAALQGFQAMTKATQ